MSKNVTLVGPDGKAILSDTTNGGLRVTPYGAGGQIAVLSAISDGVTGGTMNGAGTFLFNGTNWDKDRNNTEGTLLASAARTSTTSSTDQVNYNARGAIVYFSITAVPTVETVTLTVTAKDPIAGTYETLLTGAAEAGVATKCYMLYPGAGAAANGVDVVNAYPLPRTWRITVTHSASGSFTYSVGYALIL